MTREQFVRWETNDGMVMLRGNELLIVKSRGGSDGALATRDQYENFKTSFAHAFADDRGVMRLGRTIATLEALTILAHEGADR